jgi:hypothetical protein
LKVWFKNRRAKIRQQAAQGKPIVSNSESDAAGKTPPKLKKSSGGGSSPGRHSGTPPSSSGGHGGGFTVKSEARSPVGLPDSSSSSAGTEGGVVGPLTNFYFCLDLCISTVTETEASLLRYFCVLIP